MDRRNVLKEILLLATSIARVKVKNKISFRLKITCISAWSQPFTRIRFYSMFCGESKFAISCSLLYDLRCYNSQDAILGAVSTMRTPLLFRGLLITPKSMAEWLEVVRKREPIWSGAQIRCSFFIYRSFLYDKRTEVDYYFLLYSHSFVTRFCFTPTISFEVPSDLGRTEAG